MLLVFPLVGGLMLIWVLDRVVRQPLVPGQLGVGHVVVRRRAALRPGRGLPGRSASWACSPSGCSPSARGRSSPARWRRSTPWCPGTTSRDRSRASRRPRRSRRRPNCGRPASGLRPRVASGRSGGQSAPTASSTSSGAAAGEQKRRGRPKGRPRLVEAVGVGTSACRESRLESRSAEAAARGEWSANGSRRGLRSREPLEVAETTQRPVGEEGPPDDGVARHGAPVAAVGSSRCGCRPSRSSGLPARGRAAPATRARRARCWRRGRRGRCGSVTPSTLSTNESFGRTPLTKRWPSRTASRSPGSPTTRLMSTSLGGSGRRKTMMSPRCTER